MALWRVSVPHQWLYQHVMVCTLSQLPTHCGYNYYVIIVFVSLYNSSYSSLVPSRKNRMKNPSGNIVQYSWYSFNFHMFRQEFERANRNATFFNPCNSEDGKCELHVHSFTILTSVWLQLRQLTPWLHSAEYVLVSRIVDNVTRRIFPPIFRLGTRLQL